MRKRDIVATIIIAIVAVFLVWFVVFGGANPFMDYLNVKVIAPVECFGWFCWFDHLNVKMEFAPQFKTLQWYCGPFGGARNIESTLTVENPDYSITDFGKQSKGSCEAKPVEFFWKVPLDKGAGSYNIKTTTCGDRQLLGWICVEKTDTYYYGG